MARTEGHRKTGRGALAEPQAATCARVPKGIAAGECITDFLFESSIFQSEVCFPFRPAWRCLHQKISASHDVNML